MISSELAKYSMTRIIHCTASLQQLNSWKVVHWQLTTVQNSLQQLKDVADFKLFRQITAVTTVQITAVTTVTSACTV